MHDMHAYRAVLAFVGMRADDAACMYVCGVEWNIGRLWNRLDYGMQGMRWIANQGMGIGAVWMLLGEGWVVYAG